MRNFSKTLTLMGLLAPVGVNALGVGEIKLHSALNQVLEAEIPLIASGSESTSDIRVSLASPTAFAKAGIERPYYLARLRFTPVVKNGRMVVKVASKDVIREPFLNFLVEVNWPQGRMLREFTVLLDPPATFDQSVITATKAPMVKSTTVTKPSYAVDQPSHYGFRATSPTQKSSTSPKKNRTSQKKNRSAQNKYKAGDFVSSRRNDSLWGLARRVSNDSSVSREQMMVALYQANAHAFFKKNMNALKAGQRLKVPSRDAAMRLSRREAIAELGRQNDLWSGKVSAVSEETTSSPVAKSGEPAKQQDSKLKLVSPSVGETVAKSSSESAGSTSVGKADLAMEMAETVSQENDELRSRLKEIEEQMARMQLMLTLKDKQLNALQSQQGSEFGSSAAKVIDLAADKQPAGSSETGSLSVEAGDVPLTVASEEDAGKPMNMVQPGVAGDQSDSLVQESSVPGVGTDKSLSKAESVVSETTSETKPTPVIAPQVAEKDRVTPPVEDDLLTELLSEPFYLATGAGGAVLLAILGWALVRRRNRIMMVETESILSAPDTIRQSIAENTEVKKEETSQIEDIGMVAESSFLSEFTPSDFDALETDHDDVDPISEADVYLAYGRYQQAEDLIRSAIENYPERDECKLKLLEIHYATEDRDAYESYAKELESLKNDKPEFWTKVAEMGREICPQSALFSVDVSVDQTDIADFSVETQLPFDVPGESPNEFDLGDTESQGEEDNFDGSVDITFGGVDDLDETTAVSEAESELQVEDELHEEVSEDDSADNNSIEFDTSTTDNEDNSLEYSGEVAGEESAESIAETGLDFTDELESDEAEGQHEDGLEESIETLELDMDVSDANATTDEAVSDEFSDLTDMDEIETKLDLAKAYVDMDDEDSARGILIEILEEGNDDQKSEAQALVDVLENKA